MNRSSGGRGVTPAANAIRLRGATGRVPFRTATPYLTVLCGERAGADTAAAFSLPTHAQALRQPAPQGSTGSPAAAAAACASTSRLRSRSRG